MLFRHIYPYLLILLALGGMWPQCPLAAGQLTDRDLARQLDTVSQQVLRQNPSAGSSVLVARHGRILLAKGYGMASLELNVPAVPETVYHLVGVGDQFTCIAIMQLVEQGKLSLDQDIAALVPDFPTQGRHITVRNLLAHTSGIPDYHYLGDRYMSTQGQPRAFDQVNEMFAGRPFKNEPGQEFDWNVSDFHLMAQIIEHVSHQNYGRYMLEHIYRPAGATRTVYWDDGTIVPGLASTYRLFGNGYAPELMDVMAAGGGFRLCSSVQDLFRVLLALQAGKLIRPDTLRDMLAPLPGMGDVSPLRGTLGLGTRTSNIGGHVGVSSNGVSQIASGAMYLFQQDDVIIVALANTFSGSALAVARAIARTLFDPTLDPQTAKPSATDSKQLDLPVTAEQRAGIEGTFVLALTSLPDHTRSAADFRRTYRIFEDNGDLMIQAWGEAPWRLFKRSDDRFSSAAEPQNGIAVGTTDGKVTLTIDSDIFDGRTISGARVGPADAATFRAAANP